MFQNRSHTSEQPWWPPVKAVGFLLLFVAALAAGCMGNISYDITRKFAQYPLQAPTPFQEMDMILHLRRHAHCLTQNAPGTRASTQLPGQIGGAGPPSGHPSAVHCPGAAVPSAGAPNWVEPIVPSAIARCGMPLRRHCGQAAQVATCLASLLWDEDGSLKQGVRPAGCWTSSCSRLRSTSWKYGELYPACTSFHMRDTPSTACCNATVHGCC